MRFLGARIGAIALLTASSVSAQVQTITRTGHVVALIPTESILNFDATSIPGIAVGDVLNFSATFDQADLVNPGTVLTFLGEPVGSSDFRAAGLGNGNPLNAVSITVGTHSFQLSDQGCFQDPVCIANNGMEFPTGPTLLFDGSTFLGMDSCLFEGGGGFGTGVELCQLTLDNLAPFFQSVNTSYLGYTRSDLYLIGDTSGNAVYYAQFDGPGVIGLVPEPASWAMMLLGFAGIGFATRRKSTPVLVGA